MTDHDVQLRVLERALDQMESLLGEVSESDLTTQTPCEDWSLAELVDHVVLSPGKMAEAVRGDDVDWAQPAPHVGSDRRERFHDAAEQLRQAWRESDEQPLGPDWQTAELAVHGYDLAATLGHATGELDAEVAERGLAFMQANLKPEMRSTGFGPEQQPPDGADAYQRIAAFAGRTVTPSR